MSKSKRKLDILEDSDKVISDDFLFECEKKFKSDPMNIVARNAINSVGSMLSTMNSNRVNEISHIYENTLKKKNVHATNQGASGRCWMFAALNIFRHLLINGLELEQFEFSEVYLFFWDKFERANTYLRWFIDHPDEKPGERGYEFMLCDYMSDGGWWNTFANLIEKYGIVPKSAMKETYQSCDSDDMNHIIKEKLDSAVNYMRNRRKTFNTDSIESYRKEVLSEVYDILVKFLGEPPKQFTWRTEDFSFVKVTPKHFLEVAAPTMNVRKDFVVLANIPAKGFQYYKKYTIRHTNNVYEGDLCTVMNVPMDVMARCTKNSVENGVAVWFAADVHQSFNWFLSSFDDKLDDHLTTFPSIEKFDKGDRMLLRNVQSCHAMAFVGFNLDSKGVVENWQVENSWGYIDPHTPGLDGFLNMSHSWFNQYVTQVVVHKKFLTRTLKTKYDGSEVVETDPWESVSSCMRVGGMRAPKEYLNILGMRMKV